MNALDSDSSLESEEDKAEFFREADMNNFRKGFNKDVSEADKEFKQNKPTRVNKETMHETNC